MDPNVCGKLLTHYWRGYGVDVEASMIESPSGRSPEKVPKWDLTGTKGCGSGKMVSWLSWMFLGYMGIYRRKKYVGGASWGPRGWGCTYIPWARPCLVEASWTPRLVLQVSRVAFVPRQILAKVSFHLDSVLYSFSTKH